MRWQPLLWPASLAGVSGRRQACSGSRPSADRPPSSRTRPLDDGLAALQRELGTALAQPGTTLGSACEKVTETLRQHGEDDITLVLARMRH